MSAPDHSGATATPRGQAQSEEIPGPSKNITNFDSLTNVPYTERCTVLSSAWKGATEPIASSTLLHNLHRITLLYILQEEWSKLEATKKDDLRSSVENCSKALEAVGKQGGCRRLQHLLEVSHEPWKRPVLKDIMEGKTPKKEDVEKWCKDEGVAGGLERLRQLCAAGGACTGAALRMARALLLLEHSHGTRKMALDTLLVLLVKKGDTRTCIDEIKALDNKEVILVIGRLSVKDKTSGRLWKHAHDTALLCSQVAVAACLAKSLQEADLFTLTGQLASLYIQQLDKLPLVLRRLLQPAETAQHIYTVCRAMQHKFSVSMRPFICELYIRALTTGMNELERQKLQDENSEAAKSTSHTLALWFISLADYLASNRSVSAECVLTAFSLYPCKQYYTRVEDCSSWMCDGDSRRESNDSRIDEAADGLVQLELDGNGSESAVTQSLPLFSDGIGVDGKGLARRLVSGEVLDAEGLGLTAETCNDLALLLSGPRLKMLTWDLSWQNLSKHCLSYMEDTAEGTKAVTKELKFVKLDYSQFEYREPEEHDMYYGIEKGYEHHLEVEEDDDEEDYWESKGPKYRRDSLDSSSSTPDSDSPISKYSGSQKKKSSKLSDSDTKSSKTKKEFKKEKKKLDQNTKIKCKVKKKKDGGGGSEKKEKKRLLNTGVPVNIKVKPFNDGSIVGGIKSETTGIRSYDLSNFNDVKALLSTAKKPPPVNTLTKPKGVLARAILSSSTSSQFTPKPSTATSTTPLINPPYRSPQTVPKQRTSDHSRKLPKPQQLVSSGTSVYRQQMDRYEEYMKRQLNEELNLCQQQIPSSKDLNLSEQQISSSKDLNLSQQIPPSKNLTQQPAKSMDYQESLNKFLQKRTATVDTVDNHSNRVTPSLQGEMKDPDSSYNFEAFIKKNSIDIEENRRKELANLHAARQEKSIVTDDVASTSHTFQWHSKTKAARKTSVKQNRQHRGDMINFRQNQSAENLRDYHNMINSGSDLRSGIVTQSAIVQKDHHANKKPTQEINTSTERSQASLLQDAMDEITSTLCTDFDQWKSSRVARTEPNSIATSVIVSNKNSNPSTPTDLSVNRSTFLTNPNEFSYFSNTQNPSVTSKPKKILDFSVSRVMEYDYVSPLRISQDALREKREHRNMTTITYPGVNNVTREANFNNLTVKSEKHAFSNTNIRDNVASLHQHLDSSSANSSTRKPLSKSVNKSERFSHKKAEEMPAVNIKIANPHGIQINNDFKTSSVKYEVKNEPCTTSLYPFNDDPHDRLKTLSEVSLLKVANREKRTSAEPLDIKPDMSLKPVTPIKDMMADLKQREIILNNALALLKSKTSPKASPFQTFIDEMTTLVNAGADDNNKPLWKEQPTTTTDGKLNTQQHRQGSNSNQHTTEKRTEELAKDLRYPMLADLIRNDVKREMVPQTYARKNYTSQMKKQSMNVPTQSVASNSAVQNLKTDNSAILRMNDANLSKGSSKTKPQKSKQKYGDMSLPSSSSQSPVLTKAESKIYNRSSQPRKDSKERHIELLKNPIRISKAGLPDPNVSSALVPPVYSPRYLKDQSKYKPRKKSIDRSLSNVVEQTSRSMHVPMDWSVRTSEPTPLPSFSTFNMKLHGANVMAPLDFSNIYSSSLDSSNNSKAQSKVTNPQTSTSHQITTAKVPSAGTLQNQYKTDTVVSSSNANDSKNHISINTINSNNSLGVRNLLLFRKIKTYPSSKDILLQDVVNNRPSSQNQPQEYIQVQQPKLQLLNQILLQQPHPIQQQQTQPVKQQQSQTVQQQQTQQSRPVQQQQSQPIQLQQSRPVQQQQQHTQPVQRKQTQSVQKQQTQPIQLQKSCPVQQQQNQPIELQQSRPVQQQQSQSVQQQSVQSQQSRPVQQQQSQLVQQKQVIQLQQQQSQLIQLQQSSVIQPQLTLVIQPQATLVLQSQPSLIIQPLPSHTIQSEQSNSVPPQQSSHTVQSQESNQVQPLQTLPVQPQQSNQVQQIEYNTVQPQQLSDCKEFSDVLDVIERDLQMCLSKDLQGNTDKSKETSAATENLKTPEDIGRSQCIPLPWHMEQIITSQNQVGNCSKTREESGEDVKNIKKINDNESTTAETSQNVLVQNVHLDSKSGDDSTSLFKDLNDEILNDTLHDARSMTCNNLPQLPDALLDDLNLCTDSNLINQQLNITDLETSKEQQVFVDPVPNDDQKSDIEEYQHLIIARDISSNPNKTVFDSKNGSNVNETNDLLKCSSKLEIKNDSHCKIDDSNKSTPFITVNVSSIVDGHINLKSVHVEMVPKETNQVFTEINKDQIENEALNLQVVVKDLQKSGDGSVAGDPVDKVNEDSAQDEKIVSPGVEEEDAMDVDAVKKGAIIVDSTENSAKSIEAMEIGESALKAIDLSNSAKSVQVLEAFESDLKATAKAGVIVQVEFENGQYIEEFKETPIENTNEITGKSSKSLEQCTEEERRNSVPIEKSMDLVSDRIVSPASPDSTVNEDKVEVSSTTVILPVVDKDITDIIVSSTAVILPDSDAADESVKEVTEKIVEKDVVKEISSTSTMLPVDKDPDNSKQLEVTSTAVLLSDLDVTNAIKKDTSAHQNIKNKIISGDLQKASSDKTVEEYPTIDLTEANEFYIIPIKIPTEENNVVSAGSYVIMKHGDNASIIKKSLVKPLILNTPSKPMIEMSKPPSKDIGEMSKPPSKDIGEMLKPPFEPMIEKPQMLKLFSKPMTEKPKLLKVVSKPMTESQKIEKISILTSSVSASSNILKIVKIQSKTPTQPHLLTNVNIMETPKRQNNVTVAPKTDTDEVIELLSSDDENEDAKRKTVQFRKPLPTPPSFIAMVDIPNSLKKKKIRLSKKKKGDPYMAIDHKIGLVKVSSLPQHDLHKLQMMCTVNIVINDFSSFESISKENEEIKPATRSVKRKSSEIESTLQDIQNIGLEYKESERSTTCPPPTKRRCGDRKSTKSKTDVKKSDKEATQKLDENSNKQETTINKMNEPEVISLSEESENEDDKLAEKSVKSVGVNTEDIVFATYNEASKKVYNVSIIKSADEVTEKLESNATEAPVLLDKCNETSAENNQESVVDNTDDVVNKEKATTTIEFNVESISASCTEETLNKNITDFVVETECIEIEDDSDIDETRKDTDIVQTDSQIVAVQDESSPSVMTPEIDSGPQEEVNQPNASDSNMVMDVEVDKDSIVQTGSCTDVATPKIDSVSQIDVDQSNAKDRKMVMDVEVEDNSIIQTGSCPDATAPNEYVDQSNAHDNEMVVDLEVDKNSVIQAESSTSVTAPGIDSVSQEDGDQSNAKENQIVVDVEVEKDDTVVQSGSCSVVTAPEINSVSQEDVDQSNVKENQMVVDVEIEKDDTIVQSGSCSVVTAPEINSVSQEDVDQSNAKENQMVVDVEVEKDDTVVQSGSCSVVIAPEINSVSQEDVDQSNANDSKMVVDAEAEEDNSIIRTGSCPDVTAPKIDSISQEDVDQAIDNECNMVIKVEVEEDDSIIRTGSCPDETVPKIDHVSQEEIDQSKAKENKMVIDVEVKSDSVVQAESSLSTTTPKIDSVPQEEVNQSKASDNKVVIDVDIEKDDSAVQTGSCPDVTDPKIDSVPQEEIDQSKASDNKMVVDVEVESDDSIVQIGSCPNVTAPKIYTVSQEEVDQSNVKENKMVIDVDSVTAPETDSLSQEEIDRSKAKESKMPIDVEINKESLVQTGSCPVVTAPKIDSVSLEEHGQSNTSESNMVIDVEVEDVSIVQTESCSGVTDLVTETIVLEEAGTSNINDEKLIIDVKIEEDDSNDPNGTAVFCQSDSTSNILDTTASENNINNSMDLTESNTNSENDRSETIDEEVSKDEKIESLYEVEKECVEESKNCGNINLPIQNLNNVKSKEVTTADEEKLNLYDLLISKKLEKKYHHAVVCVERMTIPTEPKIVINPIKKGNKNNELSTITTGDFVKLAKDIVECKVKDDTQSNIVTQVNKKVEKSIDKSIKLYCLPVVCVERMIIPTEPKVIINPSVKELSAISTDNSTELAKDVVECTVKDDAQIKLVTEVEDKSIDQVIEISAGNKSVDSLEVTDNDNVLTENCEEIVKSKTENETVIENVVLDECGNRSDAFQDSEAGVSNSLEVMPDILDIEMNENFPNVSLSQNNEFVCTIGNVCDMENSTVNNSAVNETDTIKIQSEDIHSLTGNHDNEIVNDQHDLPSISAEELRADRNIRSSTPVEQIQDKSEETNSVKKEIVDDFEKFEAMIKTEFIPDDYNPLDESIEYITFRNDDNSSQKGFSPGKDVDHPIVLKNPVKTYTRSHKRKVLSITSDVVASPSKVSKINLPKSFTKNTTTLLNDNIAFDDFTVKDTLKYENLNCRDIEDFSKEDMEIASIQDISDSPEMMIFLSDFEPHDDLLDMDDPRGSFYSPIFTDDDIQSKVAEHDEFMVNNLDIEELMIRHQKTSFVDFSVNDDNVVESKVRHRKTRSTERRKRLVSKYAREGFGFRSDRDVSSDLLNGRQEGPAALSDSPNPRLPITLDVNNGWSQGENGIIGNDNNEMEKFVLIQANLENCYNNCAMVLKRVGQAGREVVTPLSENKFKVLYETNKKPILKTYSREMKVDKDYVRSVLSKVPGMSDLNHIHVPPPNIVVNVVQVGQLPVSSAQQSPLPGTPTRSNSTNEYIEVASNNSEYSTINNENQESNDSSQIIKEVNSEDNATPEQNQDNNSIVECPALTETNASDDKKEETTTNNESQQSPVVHVTSSPETVTLNPVPTLTTSNTIPVSSAALDGQVQLIFAPQSMIQPNYVTSHSQEHKEGDGNAESIVSIVHGATTNTITTSQSFNPVSRAQTLVNILSQKIIRPPVSGVNTSQVQMATFPKGTPINALSLQQALAQILPPPLSQASGDGSQNVTHPTGPQVVHIVQGKTAGQPGGSFSGLLMDNSQQSLVNVSGGTQVLHIVQGKNTIAGNNTTVLGQSHLSGTSFGGLSLVDAGSQQGGNQVLHIVNAGGQSKNNAATAQLLKRVNLLTSLTNSPGNEQKMVQFVCKSADGKSIQLNAPHQRGMVLRLQPIETPTSIAQQKTVDNLVTTNTTIIQQVPKKSPTSADQSQEIKSRSIYEENYAKFIQNSKLSPISTEKSSTILPKFNQAFGKSMFQDTKTDSDTNQSVSNEPSNQELSNTIGLAQMGQLSSPPLLIRKTQQPGTTQNIVGHVKQGMTPMNIQTMHGGVIYTRQIPVNIGGGQTINLITVPSTELIDEAQLQAIQKQVQEKNNEHQQSQQIEPQVIKLVPQQDQNQQNVTLHVDASSEDANQSFADQQQSNINTHPLLAQMRIKVPMLSKSGTQMVAGTRVVRPVFQIQRNIIPGTNPQVYQQLVLTTAPALRPPTPAPQQPAVRPPRPPTATSTPQQESNLSSSTLEQLREFDMVLEQVKERSTVQPGSNSNSTFSESSPRQNIDSDVTIVQTTQPAASVTPTPQREVLYSIGPNHTVNVTYVNKSVLSGNSTVLTTYPQNQETTTIVNMGQQNSPQIQIGHGLTNSINNPKPTTPTKVNSSKTMKPKTSKPPSSITPSSSKASPVAPKTSVQKPLEDEQTTQRILYILAEYKEQVENSPDKDKPAPRRRSNPPTNPSTSSKRKKGSGGSSKKGSNGQSLQEMSPLGDDAGHTMGSEDSSCGLSQGECAENSIQGPESQSPQGSPSKAARKLVFPPEPEVSNPPVTTQPQRNVIIADGQTIAMTRPGPGGKATAVLMPANYLLPMSMVKGGQQITIVTNQGPKILNMPQGEGGSTNTLFLQRLISPAGLKPMLARPGQVRQVRLANAVQNLQAFNLAAAQNVTTNQEGQQWIGGQQVNNQQPKLLVEYSPSINHDLNPDSVKSEASDVQSLKEENMSVSGGSEIATPRHSEASGDELSSKNRSSDEGIFSGQTTDSATDDSVQSTLHSRTDQVLHHIQVTKAPTNATVNLIQVHSLNPNEPGKIYSVQNPASLGSLIRLAGKTPLGQAFQTINIQGVNPDLSKVSPDVQECAQNLLLVRKNFDGQYTLTTSSADSALRDIEMKNTNLNQLHQDMQVEASPSPGSQQSYALGHGDQLDDNLPKVDNEGNVSWSLSSGGGRSVVHGGAEGTSPGYVTYSADSPSGLVHQAEQADVSLRESDHDRRVLRHEYSPDGGSPAPSTPRHLYHKMFISSPDKADHTVQDHLKKDEHSQSSTITLQSSNSPSFTIHHHHGSHQLTSGGPSSSGSSGHGAHNHQSASGSGQHSSGHTHHHPIRLGDSRTPHHVLRHKYALMEHELRLQKSLSEECEDLGVDSPSASELFPEADLLFSNSPSSQFDHSQDGQMSSAVVTNTGSTSNIGANSSNAVTNISGLHGAVGVSASTTGGTSLSLRDENMIPVDEEFARMHPNTTFHSGEIDILDEQDDIPFRGTTKRIRTLPGRRNEMVRSVIEGIGSSGMPTIYQPNKVTTHFSLVGMPKRGSINIMSLQSSDDNSEGAEDSMNSAESKDGLVNNKHLDGILNSNITRDVNLSASDSPGCLQSNIIQRNVAQVIRHASEEQMLSGKDGSKLCEDENSPGPQNGRSFLLENTPEVRQGDSMILKTLMMERDGRDGLTCSSPEQHSELFWESNSNSNQSDEPMTHGTTNLLDFSSEDSNKCCKSPPSCEETNSTDSSSIGGMNLNSDKPLRLNSVIKTSGSTSTAADGPILHSALTSNLPINVQESRKLDLNLHKSDSNTSTSPDGEIMETSARRPWGRSLKSSGVRRVLSPRSLSTEINMGAEIETSSSEGVNILTKSGPAIIHSGSSTPEDSAVVGRRASLRGSNHAKRSCHCCPPPSPPAHSTNSTMSSASATSTGQTTSVSSGQGTNATGTSSHGPTSTPARGRNRRRQHSTPH